MPVALWSIALACIWRGSTEVAGAAGAAAAGLLPGFVELVVRLIERGRHGCRYRLPPCSFAHAILGLEYTSRNLAHLCQRKAKILFIITNSHRLESVVWQLAWQGAFCRPRSLSSVLGRENQDPNSPPRKRKKKMCRRKERLAFRRPPLAFSARRPRPTHADAGTAAPTTSPFEVEDRASFSFASNPHLHSRLSNLSNLHLPLSFPNSQLPALAIASAHRHPQVVRLPTPFGLPPTPAILSPSLACHSAALQV